MQRLIALCICMIVAFAADAQFKALRKAKNRLVDRVVDRTIDKAADKVAEKAADKIIASMDDLFNADGTPKVDENGNPRIGILGTLQGPPSVVHPNPQVVSFQMNMELTDSKDNGTVIIDYAFDTWKTGVQMQMTGENAETAEMKIYHDLEAKKTTTAMKQDGEWKAFRTWLPNFTVLLNEEASGNTVEATPTGNTKTIEGYLCKEYAVKTQDSEGTIWVTEDIDINMVALAQSMGLHSQRNGQRLTQGLNATFDKGFWLESDLRMEDGSRVKSTMRQIRMDGNINRVPFDMAGIPIEYDLTERTSMEGN